MKNNVGFFKMLRNRRHYRMEIFSVLLIFLMTVFLIVTALGFKVYLSKQSVELTNKAIYTTNFKTSLSEQNGKVEGVFKSKDGSKALLLIKFDSTANMSIDAKNYQLFLTSANVKGNDGTLRSRPSASIYMFGNTGYMGIYLANADGFKSQVLDLTVRANKELTGNSETPSSKESDASFSKYDQFRVYFNPGAGHATILKCLEGSKIPTAKDLYDGSVTAFVEKDVHKLLNDQVEKLRLDLNNIEEKENRVFNSDKIQKQARPSIISGDKIIETKDSDDNKTYKFVAGSTVKGGVDFDWTEGSVSKGYLKSLISKEAPGLSMEQYFTMKYKESSENEFDINSYTWLLEDGTALKDTAGSENVRYKGYNEDVQDMTAAWRQYYNDKKEYQTKLLFKLLEAETYSNIVKDTTTINTSDKVIQLY